MNLTQLRAFYAVAREGSFTRGAARLHVTQPAVTGHVAALEAQYQVPLLRRHARRVDLTDAGRRLFDIARELFGQEERAEDYLQALGALRTGHLRIAAGSPYLLAPLLARFRERYPGVTVSITGGNVETVLQALLDEEVDIAVQTGAVDRPEVLETELASQHLCALLRRDSPLARRGSPVDLAELVSHPLILREPQAITRRLFDEACADAGLVPSAAVTAASREAVAILVASGLGVGVVLSSELPAEGALVAMPLAAAVQPVQEYVLCLGRRRELGLLSAFLELVEEQAGTPAGETL